MAVVAFHALQMWAGSHTTQFLRILGGPLGIFFDGPDAVLLFFVLSGFVLFLSYVTQYGFASYPSFIVKRVCRLYLPYLAALGIAILADWYFYQPFGDPLSSSNPWVHSFPTRDVLRHLAFLSASYIYKFLPVAWTLIHEMRISLAFPIIAWLAKRLPLAGGLFLGFAMCAAGLMPLVFNRYLEWVTIGYAGLFLLGACIACHLDRISSFAAKIGPYGRGLGFVLAIGLLKSMHFMPDRLNVYPTQATLHGAALVLIVVLAITTVHFRAFLHTSVLRWLGRVSYSLYLVHLTIFLAMKRLFWRESAPHAWLLVVVVIVSLAFADLFYRCVERPSMLLGRRLSRGLARSEVNSVSTSEALQRTV